MAIKGTSKIRWLGWLVVLMMILPQVFFPTSDTSIRVAEGAGGQPSDLEGAWTLTWSVNSATTCPTPVGTETLIEAVISQQDDQIELFTTGFDNTPTGPAVSLAGEFYTDAGDLFYATATYYDRIERIEAHTTADGVIDADGTFITINYFHAGCSVTADLVSAVRNGDAPVHTVCTTAGDGCDYTSIQDAVDDAAEGDIIKIAEGTYTGQNNLRTPNMDAGDPFTQTVFISKSVTLRGGYSADNWAVPDPQNSPSVIDANNDGRALYVTGSYDGNQIDTRSNVVLTGLTLTNGNSAALTGTLTTGNDRVPASMGGAAFVVSSTISIADSRITDSSALATDTELASGEAGYGGGLAFVDSTVTILDSEISGNQSNDGGGIFSYLSDGMILGNNTISDNNSIDDTTPISNRNYGYGGGATLLVNLNGVTFNDNVVSGNTSDLRGGGILIPNTYGETQVMRNEIYNNTAVDMGGGGIIDNEVFRTYTTASIDVRGNKIYNNTVTDGSGLGGGGLVMARAAYNVTIANNIFYSNESQTDGSGLFVRGADADIFNNTFANHDSGSGDAVYISGYAPAINGTGNLTNNIIVGNTIGVSIDDSQDHSASLDSTLWGSGDWANGDNLDPTGETPQSNTNEYTGDPAFVDPDNGDYHITDSSAALNQGTDLSTYDILDDYDEDGRPLGDAYDIGADEHFTDASRRPNIEGEWLLTWQTTADTTCSFVPVGNPVVIRATVSQSGNDIELYTPGYNNIPQGFAVGLPGAFAEPFDGSFQVKASYFRIHETLDLVATHDNLIDSGMVETDSEDGFFNQNDSPCTIHSELVSAVRLRDAPVRTVCDDGCTHTSIQDAIDASADRTMIKVAEGTYTTLVNRNDTTQIVYIDRDISLRGGYSTDNWAIPDPETNVTTLDPAGQGRGIHIDAAPEGTEPPGHEVVITGFRITNGDAAGQGGARFAPPTDPAADGIGGGLYANSAAVTLIDNEFTNNSAVATDDQLLEGVGGYGGGAGLFASAVFVRNNTFSNNSSNDGGGLFSSLSFSLFVGDNIFNDNSSIGEQAVDSPYDRGFGYGGGMTAFLNAVDTVVIDNVAYNNTADFHGGGLLIPFNFVPSLVSGNTVYNNTSQTLGGGIIFDRGESGTLDVFSGALGMSLGDNGVTMTRNKLYGNDAPLGHAIVVASTNAYIANNFLFDNTGTTTTIPATGVQLNGGAIFAEQTDAEIVHNTFVNNEEGAVLAGRDPFIDDGGSSVELVNNIMIGNGVGVAIDDASDATIDSTLWGDNDQHTNGAGTLTSQTNDYTGDPAFIGPDNRNYHIEPTSAAVDRGVDAGVSEDYDQATRPVGDAPDLGADEARAPDAPPPSLAGEWDLYASANSGTTCDFMPVGTEFRFRILISQDESDIELFTAGYNNSNTGDPVVAFPGTIDQSGNLTATASYLREYAVLNLNAPDDETIESGSVTIDYGDQGCSVSSDLMHAVRLGDNPVLTVCDNTTDCDYTSVQNAVTAARAGDTIKVAAGTYTAINNQGGEPQVVYTSKDIILRGGYTTDNWVIPDPDANATVLDAQGQGRVMRVAGDGSRVILTGLTLTGGDAAGLGDTLDPVEVGVPTYVAGAIGGGIYIRDGALTVIESDINSNSALADATDLLNDNGGHGGGIAAFESSLVVRDSTITDNVSQDGGGVYSFHAGAGPDGRSLMFSKNTIASNTAQYSASDDEGTINEAYGYGGGVTLFYNRGAVAFHDNTVHDNTSDLNGGGVLIPFNPDIQVDVSGNTIYNNTARVLGGGALIDHADDFAFNQNVVYGNTADYGGGVALEASTSDTNQAVNNIVVGNTATSRGSGILVEATQVQLIHNTIADNTGGEGSGVYVTEYDADLAPEEVPRPDPSTSSATLINNIIAGNLQGITVDEGNSAELESTLWGTGDEANTNQNVEGTGTVVQASSQTGDPAFVDPGANNYHLMDTSAAIDAGQDADIAQDIDGQSRPIGDMPDIGADEQRAAGTVSNIQGQWELTWMVNAAGTTCPNIPADMTASTIWVISQQDSDIELFTRGYDNQPAGTPVSLVGQFADTQTFGVSDSYNNATEVISGTTTEDGMLDAATRTMTYHDGMMSAGAACVIAYDLQNAQRLGDAAIQTVCGSGCDYSSTQQALAGTGSGSIIKLAGGTYTNLNNEGSTLAAIEPDVSLEAQQKQVVYINQDVTLRGGYSTDNWAIPDPTANPTVLDARGAGRVAYITGAQEDVQAILMGLTLTNGNVEGIGGGVYAYSSTLYMVDTIVDDNQVSPISFESGTTNGAGGGIALENNASLMMRDSTIADNTAQYGGGVAAFGSPRVELHNTTLARNSASADGGGGYLEQTDYVFVGASGVYSNTATSGGGLDLAGASMGILVNNIIAENQAPTDGSGLRLAGVTANLVNNTLASNQGNGSGVSVIGSGGVNSSVQLTNTILVSSTVGINVAGGSSATLDSTLWGGGGWINEINTSGDGTINTTNEYSGTVGFANPDMGDYHLTSGSAAIDQGATTPYITDIDGDTRPLGNGFDIGADEFDGAAAESRVYLPLLMK